MERMIGLILIVGVVWAGIEYYTKGEQAFGGVFASGEASADAEQPWAGERAGAKLRAGHAERGERMERALGEE
jgi:hypothetical protein